LPRANGDRLAVAFLIGLRPADDPRRGPQDELCAAAGIARQLEKSSWKEPATDAIWNAPARGISGDHDSLLADLSRFITEAPNLEWATAW
jgi:hypothetical protein